MHKFRQAVLVASATALALSAFAAPAVAAPGKATIGIVNGIPNTRVDICVNGKELRSAAKYGQAVAKVVQAGSKVIKIYQKDPRICRGKVIAKKTMNLPAGSDFTLVVTKKAPKWLKFSNISTSPPYHLGQIWPKGVAEPTFHMAWRHAADLGTLGGRYSVRQTNTAPLPPLPSADSPWIKGDQFVVPNFTVTPGVEWSLGFARLDKPSFLAHSRFVEGKAGYRYEFYLLGTWAGNAKVIVWARPVTAPAP